MIIFLDFDGVLHPEPATEAEAFQSAQLFWRIMEACPTAEVVFSTSWRNEHTLEELIRFATAGGGEQFAHRFIGATPMVIPDAVSIQAGDYRKRERECLAWLQGNALADRPWLAIDDVHHWFAYESPHVHIVDYRVGLSTADVSEILRKLGADALELGDLK